MAQQRFLNNFDTQFIAAVKSAPTSGNPATELDYGILRVSTGAAGALGALTNGDWYTLTGFKRSGSVETNVEIMKVTAVDTSVINEVRLTVLRGQEGTTPQSYVSGDYLSMRETAGSLAAMVQNTDPRLSDSRAPTGAAGGVLSGTYPNPGFAVDMATQAELDAVASAKEPNIAAGSTAQYWRGDKGWRDFATDVRAAVLTGLSAATNAAVAATDSVLVAIGKLQKQVTDLTAGTRTMLSASTTYYVRTDGSDSNNGLANTSGGAFLTIQKAVDVVSAFDLNGVVVTISVADGTYTGAVVLKKFSGSGTIIIQGNTATPANCLINVSGGNCFTADGVTGYTVTGVKVTGNIGFSGYNYATIRLGNVDFGAMASYGLYASTGAVLILTSSFKISAGGVWFIYTSSLGVVNFSSGTTVTITGTPAFSGGFINADRLSEVIVYGITFSGAATGPRYQAVNNSVIYTNSGGATYLPGDSAGSTGSGGQYV